MTFSVTILGSSSALPTSTRFPTAQVFQAHERFFLIDCGEGTQIQLRRFQFSLLKINHIFISHLHGDHYFGLFGLLSSLSLLGKKNVLNIYAHKELIEIVNNQFQYYQLTFEIKFHVIEKEKFLLLYEDKNITVETFPLKHRIATNGFLFREKKRDLNIKKGMIDFLQLSVKDILKIKQGHEYIDSKGKVYLNKDLTLNPYKRRSYAFCSDTAYSPTIIQYLKNVDMLYHEATFAEDMKDRAEKTMHSTAKQAGMIAKEADVKKLLIGHFSSRYKDESVLLAEAKTVFKATESVIEGESYSVPLVRDLS